MEFHAKPLGHVGEKSLWWPPWTTILMALVRPRSRIWVADPAKATQKIKKIGDRRRAL
jgi:hypothetical protein